MLKKTTKQSPDRPPARRFALYQTTKYNWSIALPTIDKPTDRPTNRPPARSALLWSVSHTQYGHTTAPGLGLASSPALNHIFIYKSEPESESETEFETVCGPIDEPNELLSKSQIDFKFC